MPNGDGTSGPGPRPGERALQQILLQQVQAGTISWAEARREMERFYIAQGVSAEEALRKIQEFIVPYLGGQDFWTATTQQSGGVRPQHTWEPDPTQPGGVRLQPIPTGGVPFDPSGWPPPPEGGGLRPTPPPALTEAGGVSPTYVTAEQYDPYTAFLQGLGVGGREYLSPVEQYKVGQYAPAERLFGVGQKVSEATGAAIPDTIQDYALALAGQASGARGTARSYLQSIMGLTPEQRAAAEVGYTPKYGWNEDLTERVLTGEEGDIRELQNLLKLAYAGHGGGEYGRFLARRAGKEQQIYASRQAAGEQLDPFMQYLQKKYNLKF